jgi:hypothetical protein
MEDNETTRMSDAELRKFFGQMFPDGFAGADVVREIAPAEWKSSPLFACFHPSPEQVLAELLRMHRVSQELRALRCKNTLEEPERPDIAEPTIEQVLAEWEDQPVNLTDEVTSIVGACLWDVFADNHNVVAADGRAVDIGSFRGASAFLDECVTGLNQSWDGGDAQGACLARLARDDALFPQQPEVGGNRISAAKAEMVGDFLHCGHGAARLLEFLKKFDDFLLLSGQSNHTVQMHSITNPAGVELFTK